MRSALEKRLRVLEDNPLLRPPSPPEPSASDLLSRQKAQEFLDQLDEKYIALMNEDAGRSPQEWSNLTLAVLSRVQDHLRENRPLAFPVEVADIYLAETWVGDDAWCTACRYKLPRGYFKLCPLCGGQVTG